MYLYILDTMADWEPGFLLAELGSGRFFRSPDQRYTLRLCGRTRDPVTTMGGLHLTPELTLGEIEPAVDRVLILPGADTWLDPLQVPEFETISRYLETGMVIAAICGATLGLAQAGLLDNRPHTSNDLNALKMFCPGYAGEHYYVTEPAVTDGNLVTASGLAPVDFAYQVLKKLGLMRESTLEAWYHLHLTKKPEYYYRLMESLGE